MIRGRLKLTGLPRDVRAAATWALGWADYYDVPITITSGARSWANQTRLRRNYEACLARGDFKKTPECQWPANRPGDSAHNYGWAWDSTTSPEYQQWWNAVREMAGFDVPANDVIHAEVPDWRSYK
jgi:hypothetical protein